MISISIPSWGELHLKHLLLDYNGTMACDGKLLPGVRDLLLVLQRDVQVHVITADTFGSVEEELLGIPCSLHILPTEAQDLGKLQYLKSLQGDVVACGNGRNDVLMLKEAALGMMVLQKECAAGSLFAVADVVGKDLCDVLELLLNPRRLVATLRQ